MDKFTVEEINLMCIYDISSRNSLLTDLQTALGDIYEPEMIEIFESAIEKLDAITDEDFEDIGFYIADDFLSEEEFNIGE